MNVLHRLAIVTGWVLLSGLCGAAMAQSLPGAAAPARPTPPDPAAVPPPAPGKAGDWTDRQITNLAGVDTLGEGPIPMILVPTIGCDWTVWKSFMERNAHRYSMFAVTLPGVGGSSAPELRAGENWEHLPLTLNAEKAIIRFVEASRMDKPVIMGHGYGGHLAMRIVLARPDLFRAVISIDGMPKLPMADPTYNPTLDERKEIIRRSTLKELMSDPDDVWRQKQYANTLMMVQDDLRARDIADMINRTPRGILVSYYLELLLSDVTEPLKNLQTPMMVVAPLTPPPPPTGLARDTWRRVLGGPPMTTLTYYENTRHFVMDDNPEQLDVDVARFLAGQDIPGAFRTAELNTPFKPEGQGLPADRTRRGTDIPGYVSPPASGNQPPQAPAPVNPPAPKP